MGESRESVVDRLQEQLRRTDQRAMILKVGAPWPVVRIKEGMCHLGQRSDSFFVCTPLTSEQKP